MRSWQLSRSLVLLGLSCLALAACVSTRPTQAPSPWASRMPQLQQAQHWQMSGRAAVAVGIQGWQASLDWRQQAGSSEVHLAGPLGVGAVVLRSGADGLSVNGAPPDAAVIAQMQDRLGFDLPLNDLRYWLLGVPNPAMAFEMTRNDIDRALSITQGGWTLNYDRYLPVNGDLLPTRLVMSREGVRVRIAVDRWEGVR